MDKTTVTRIKSLEHSIYALRQLNQSDTLRPDVKERNNGRIYSYTNEVYDHISDELVIENRPLGFQSINYLGYELVLS